MLAPQAPALPNPTAQRLENHHLVCKGRFEEALFLVDQIGQFNPLTDEDYEIQGICLMALNRMEEAREAFSFVTALERNTLSTQLTRDPQIRSWLAAGKPSPPPSIVKHLIIAQHASTFQLRHLVETGTYLGTTTAALRNLFTSLLSIEIEPQLAHLAHERFAQQDHIGVIEGDSAQVIAGILELRNRPHLFWLDAQYDGGITGYGTHVSPLSQELSVLLNHPSRHVILINGVERLGTDPSSPSIHEIQERIRQAGDRYTLSVQDDIVRLVPSPFR